MCIRDHNAWLASNWFPIPGAGLGRPRGTRARAYERSESGALYTRREYSFQVLGSDRNWIVQPGSVKSRFTGGAQYYHSATWWFRCVHRRARCPTSRSRVHWREIYWTTCVYWTTPCVRNVCSFDTISLFLFFFFFLEKVGLRPTRFFVLFYREYTVFKWTSISISTNLAFRLEVFGILDRWFLYLYSCLYLYILNNYAKRDIWSGDRIGIVEEFCGKKRWIQDF